MRFEWDEAKRECKIAKHEVDFIDVQPLFDGRLIYTTESRRNDEDRYVSTGVIDGRYYTVVWVWRGEVIRLISARRSRDGEKRAHRTLHGGGN